MSLVNVAETKNAKKDFYATRDAFEMARERLFVVVYARMNRKIKFMAELRKAFDENIFFFRVRKGKFSFNFAR